MYIIIILAFLISIIFIFSRTRSENVIRQSTWLLVAYGFLLLTHFFSGIKYLAGDLYRILPYFLLCLFLVIIGESLGALIKAPKVGKIKIRSNALCLLSFAGSSMVAYDLIRLNNINFGYRIDELSISVIGTFGNMISSLGLIAWLNSLYEYRINKRKISALSYLALLAYISGGILSAGRSALMIITVSSVIILIWSARKRKEIAPDAQVIHKKAKKPVFLYVFIILVFSYLFTISNIRSGIADVSVKISEFETGFHAKTSKQTINDVKRFDLISHIYIETLFYYSHEIIRLDVLYQHYDYPPLYGIAEMGYVERRIRGLIGNEAEESWAEVERAIETKGKFSAHTWGTFVSNFIVDFGRMGALIACLLLGVFVGILYGDFRKNENPLTVVRQAIICAGIVYSIQVSPVAELVWAFPFVASSFILVKQKSQ